MRAVLAEEYESYLAACNTRDWGALRRFFGPAVVVDGQVRTMDRFVEDLRRLCRAHPDHRWRAIDVRESGSVVTACVETSWDGHQDLEFIQYLSAGPMVVQVWSMGVGAEVTVLADASPSHVREHPR